MNSPAGKDAPATFTARAIGHVRSPYARPEAVPHTAHAWTEGISTVRLLPRYGPCLRGLEGFSHIILLFWVHLRWRMPRNHSKPSWVKVFATRMPARPNPIGLSVVELVEVRPAEGELVVRGLDAVDGTPVLDIKPYIPNFDSRPEAHLPQWVREGLERHFHHHVHHTPAAQASAGAESGPSRDREDGL